MFLFAVEIVLKKKWQYKMTTFTKTHEIFA